MKVVGVRFRQGQNTYSVKTYYYFSTFDVVDGDKVVVPVSTSYEYQVAEVTEPNVTSAKEKNLATKFLVQRIDFDEFNRINDIYRSYQLKKKELDQKIKEMQEEEIYKFYAEKDPDFNNIYQDLLDLQRSL